MKKLISTAMVLLMIIAIGAVAAVSVSAEENSTVNGTQVKVGDTVVVDHYVQCSDEWEDFQGFLKYDYEGLSLQNVNMPNVEGGVMFNRMFTGFVYYTGTNYSGLYNFKDEKIFVSTEYKVTKAGNYNVENVFEIIDNQQSNKIIDLEGGIIGSDVVKQRSTVTVKEIPTSSSTTATSKPTTASQTSSEPTSQSTSSSSQIGTSAQNPPATTPVVTDVKVSSVSLKKTATVYSGKSITLKATVKPSNADNKALSWKSSNTNVAKVSAKGVVKGIKKGTAIITATAKDGSKKSAKCTVTVRQSVTKIKLSKTTVKLAKKGKSVKVKATVVPATAFNKNIAVKSANKKIAKVSAASVKSGKTVKITAVKKGNTKVTFTAKDGSKKSATLKVKVAK